MGKRTGILVLVMCFMALSVKVNAQRQEQVLRYLFPEIGGVGQLLEPTRPTMQLPNEMMRMTPQRKDYLDDQISSFPLLVVSHRLGQVFSLLPNTDARISSASWDKKVAYDQGAEQRMPWHYYTYLLDDDVSVEYTEGKKAGIFRIAFPSKSAKNILLDAYSDGKNYWHFHGNTLEAMQIYPTEEGHKPIPVYLYGRFNQPFEKGTVKGHQLAACDSIDGNKVKAYCSFERQNADTVEFRYAVSYISVQQAFVITKYPGLSPETTNQGTSSISGLYPGVDATEYPIPRTISFGVNMGLF